MTGNPISWKPHISLRFCTKRLSSAYIILTNSKRVIDRQEDNLDNPTDMITEYVSDQPAIGNSSLWTQSKPYREDDILSSKIIMGFDNHLIMTGSLLVALVDFMPILNSFILRTDRIALG